MKYLLMALAVIAILIFLLVLNAFRASWKRNRLVSHALAELRAALSSGSDADIARIASPLAARPELRNTARILLRENQKENLFPKEYLSDLRSAESDLARWLMHGNELGAAPEKIVFLQEFPIAKGDAVSHVFMFKFIAPENHWARPRGWMVGIAGPLFEEQGDLVSSGLTFSELTALDQLTLPNHLAQLQKCMAQTGWVIRC